MEEYMTASTAKMIADSYEMPTIMKNIQSLATIGEHRHILKELSADSASQLAKLGYNIQTFRSIDGDRFEIVW